MHIGWCKTGRLEKKLSLRHALGAVTQKQVGYEEKLANQERVWAWSCGIPESKGSKGFLAGSQLRLCHLQKLPLFGGGWLVPRTPPGLQASRKIGRLRFESGLDSYRPVISNE